MIDDVVKLCSVDASRAGIGNLEITVTSATDAPTNFVDADSADNAQYRVTFTPLKPETYSITVKFNGDPVPGDLLLVILYLPARLLLFYKGLHGLSAIPCNSLCRPLRNSRHSDSDTFTILSSLLDRYKY